MAAKGWLSGRRASLNRWIDGAALALGSAVALSGAVLHGVLPPGRGRAFEPPLLLGLSRHDWRVLHVWLALAFAATVVAHLALHWSWVRSNLLRLPSRARRPTSGAARDLAGTGGRGPLVQELTKGIGQFLSEVDVKCASCDQKICREGTDCTGTGEETAAYYEAEGDRRLHAAAARVEAEGYGRLCRLEEVLNFCEVLGVRRVGLPFCAGLADEAALIAEILGRRLEVVSVCCKVGAVPKEALGLPRIRTAGFEATCNPIAQARLLNEAGTELNFLVGLCLGHDMLFARHASAPVSTLVVKDRVLGHNPVAALHSSYYRRRLRPDEP